MSTTSKSVKETTIRYPEDIPQTLKMSDEEFVEELRFLGAAKLYELGRLSSGKAARLANMERVPFLYRLSQSGVAAINLRHEQIELEIQAAMDLSEQPLLSATGW
jgi:predicted HTH domain antitoxin